jgi:hypothetical protein
MVTSRRVQFAAATLTTVLITLSAGCSGDGKSVDQEPAAPAPATTSAPATDPVEAPEEAEEESEPEEPQFTELSFGDALSVKEGSEESGTSEVTLGRPKLAKCQYESIGCDEPEIGDRIVSVPITIENTGDTAVEWGRDYFLLEFDDGTQVEMGDGATFDYTPDNALDYSKKIRPNSTFKSVLVFEAPDGPFKILILTNTFDGVPFAAWS